MIRGLYGIADAGASGGDPVRMGAWLLEGGCRLIQLRCKEWEPDEVLRAARELRALGPATLIVNDLPEVALAAGADGVHLGRLDVDTGTARRLAPGLLIGRSTNSLEELAALTSIPDYVAFGPVFATENVSRPKEVQGVDRLRRARSLARAPLVAIGGITADRLAEVRPLCDAWAVIGAVATAEDPVAAVRSLL